MQHTRIIGGMISTTGHELLDFGGGARLERFGERITDRPLPAALGSRAGRAAGMAGPAAWAAADLRFDRERGWTGSAVIDEPWMIELDGLTLELRATDAGQVGLFAEHVAMLLWLRARVGSRLGRAEPPAVLHLFGYTGLATLAMAAAGAAVSHVDASRPAVAWARRNATLSRLDDRPVRWIVDDALAFTEREVRRGRRYSGVVLDPPTYGHGPRTEAWQLDENLPALLAACARITEDDGFVLLTAHTAGFGPDRLRTEVGAAFGRVAASVEAGELHLTTPDGRRLELGAFARTSGGA